MSWKTIRRVAVALGLLALIAFLLSNTAGQTNAHGRRVAVQPGQSAFIGTDGRVTVDRIDNTAIFTEALTRSCEVLEQWWDPGYGTRTWSGQLVVRAAWRHDDRGSGRDVVWIDWNYNWPGTGSGQGTGISLENKTNYVVLVLEAEMRNIPSGVIWRSDFANARIEQGNREHVVGRSDLFTGNPDGHSYLDNAPRVRLESTPANYFPDAPRDLCDAYGPNIPV